MVKPIRITTEKWMQAGAFSEEDWNLAKPLIQAQCLNGASLDEAVQVLVRLRNSPPSDCFNCENLLCHKCGGPAPRCQGCNEMVCPTCTYACGCLNV